MRERGGWLHVITGPMFSGKTESLLRILRRYDIMGYETILFRPALDTRTPTVQSRAGITYPAIPIVDPHEIRDILYPSLYCPYDVIAFDEAQFFHTDILPLIIEELLDNQKIVLVSGLDRDFLKRPFGPMETLLTNADRVDKLTAICHTCKGEASLTQRIVNGHPARYNDPIVVVGGMGDDIYEARCRLHHTYLEGARKHHEGINN